MRIVLFTLIALVYASCVKQGYRIAGRIDNVSEGIVFLNKTVGYSFEKIDSAEIIDGKFVFEGTVESPDMYGVNLKGERAYKVFCLENAKYSFIVEGKMNDAVVEGGALQLPIALFKTKMKSIETKESEIMERFRKAWRNEGSTDEEREVLRNELEEYRHSVKLKHAYDFIAKNNGSPYANVVLNTYIRNYLSIDELDSIYQTFTDIAKGSSLGVRIGKSIINTRLTSVGKQFVDISAPDSLGNIIKLSDIVKDNKYVLIDFWASWCGPCLATLPQLKDTYNKYNPKGFEVFAVSYDAERERWLDAMKKEGLRWVNVSNIKGWNCPTVNQYVVRGIPESVLISNDGKIIARGLVGNSLADKLDELFAKN